MLQVIDLQKILSFFGKEPPILGPFLGREPPILGPCFMLQVIFRERATNSRALFWERATNSRALMRKMTYKEKGSDVSSPPCDNAGSKRVVPQATQRTHASYPLTHASCLMTHDS